MNGPKNPWSGVQLQRDALGTLIDAIYDRSYPTIYACLRKQKETFDHHTALQLCYAAVRSGCTLKAFHGILEHSVPLQEIVNYSAGDHVIFQINGGKGGGLVQEAALYDRFDVLEYLLDAGCSPNSRGDSDCSALEAALSGASVGCVRVLEQRDDVDFTITETILSIWGRLGTSVLHDLCFRIVAGRLLGQEKGQWQPKPPLLPGLHALHAARAENWPLVCRLCEEAPVTESQGKEILNLYMDDGCEELDVAEAAPLLHALFTACPGLLRCEYPRYLLALCMLAGEEEDIRLLHPMVEALPGQGVVLTGRRLAERKYDIIACLRNWDERMGHRLRPVLRRDNLLPVRAAAQTDDETIRYLLEHCDVRGKPKREQISRLTLDVLQTASPGLVAELCMKDILFPQEDLQTLLDFCGYLRKEEQLQKQNILKAFCKKAVDYEL